MLFLKVNEFLPDAMRLGLAIPRIIESEASGEEIAEVRCISLF